LTAGWLEAFRGRGNGVLLVSHDLRDIVTVVDGRPALIDELRGAPEEFRTYVATEISSLLSTARKGRFSSLTRPSTPPSARAAIRFGSSRASTGTFPRAIFAGDRRAAQRRSDVWTDAAD
jgi:hypothetical protein